MLGGDGAMERRDAGFVESHGVRIGAAPKKQPRHFELSEVGREMQGRVSVRTVVVDGSTVARELGPNDDHVACGRRTEDVHPAVLDV